MKNNPKYIHYFQDKLVYLSYLKNILNIIFKEIYFKFHFKFKVKTVPEFWICSFKLDLDILIILVLPEKPACSSTGHEWNLRHWCIVDFLSEGLWKKTHTLLMASFKLFFSLLLHFWFFLFLVISFFHSWSF